VLKPIKRNLGLLLGVAACSAGLGVINVAPALAAPIGAYTTKGAYTYMSVPNLHPPKIQADAPTSSKKLAPGYFMVSNFKNLAMTQPLAGQGGPLILNSALQPVWFDPTPLNVYSLNLTTQTYQGKPALSWWEGVISNVGAVASGKDIVVDQHYRQVASLTGKDGWVLSPHEFLVRGNDAWVTANRNVPNQNLTAFGGPASAVVTDSAVQEYNLKTGALVASWSALAHIPLSQSQTRPAPGIPWDAYHVNSINTTSNGGFVTSMRNTWAAYRVDNVTRGNIEWTLGGNSSSFKFGSGATFEWQHNVQLQPGGEVSLFDDACCGVIGPGKFAPPFGPSRGLVLKLDTTSHTAALVSQYAHSGLTTSTQGDTQLLANGNVVVGWGGQPWFSEYSKAGKLLLDARFPNPDISYRAYVQNWVGTPFFPPSGAARKTKSKTMVYASWDGATQVGAWRVLAGPNAKHLATVATRAKTSFETAIGLRQSYKVFKLRALDAKGHVIGTSKAFGVTKPRASNPPPTGFY
jgi:Arylsulfotransferase (ASST)